MSSWSMMYRGKSALLPIAGEAGTGCGFISVPAGSLSLMALNMTKSDISALEGLYAAVGEDSKLCALAGSAPPVKAAWRGGRLTAQQAREAVDDLICHRLYVRRLITRHRAGQSRGEAVKSFAAELPDLERQLSRAGNKRRTTLPTLLQPEISFEACGGDTAEHVAFAALGELLIYDLYRAMTVEGEPRRCPSCGRFFISGKGNIVYCDGAAPNGDGKSCREIGAARAHAEKLSEDAAGKMYATAAGRIYTRKSRGSISAEDADRVLGECRALLAKAKNGELTEQQLKTALDKTTGKASGEKK